MSYKLLTPGKSNPKIAKGEGGSYRSAILHLAPANLSGHEVCPGRSEGCTRSCLNTSGRGKMTMVQNARVRKTRQLFEDTPQFMQQLCQDINVFARRSRKAKQQAAIRLNGTSDIDWTKYEVGGLNVFNWFPDVQFYDYTKLPERLMKFHQSNYHLTFSKSEVNMNVCKKIVKMGWKYNVAVVFRDELPKYFLGRPVIDGLASDLRFTDPSHVIVGLEAKGDAKHDQSGFVVESPSYYIRKMRELSAQSTSIDWYDLDAQLKQFELHGSQK